MATNNAKVQAAVAAIQAGLAGKGQQHYQNWARLAQAAFARQPKYMQQAIQQVMAAHQQG